MSTGFHQLEIAEVRHEIADAVSLRFNVPAALAEEFRYTPGQHLTLRADIGGEDVRRNYSICSAPAEGELRIAIKRVAEGLFSNWANSKLAAGQTLDVMPPHGSFTWQFEAGQARNYVGFAGGSGITPILSLLKTALTVEPGSRFTLLYGNRSTASVMFLEEIAAQKDRFMGRFHVQHILEEEESELEVANGRLDAEKIGQVLEHLVDPATIDAAFICGPGPMMDAAEAALIEAGVPQDHILIERFTVGKLDEARLAAARELEKKAAGKPVTITIDGRKRRLAFDPAKGTILENARTAGLPAPFACKAGVCATCRAKVINGKVEMIQNFGLSAQEVEQGYVLTCQSVPVSDEVELDFDA